MPTSDKVESPKRAATAREIPTGRTARVITFGTTPLEAGRIAIVTMGPSKGTIVRLVEKTKAPPGSSAMGLYYYARGGALWRVDKVLKWEVGGLHISPKGVVPRAGVALSSEILKITGAPATALRAITYG